MIVFQRPIRRSFFTNGSRVKAENPFSMLGLEWGATATEIKAAYRKQAARLHPDLNPTDKTATAKFQRLTEAYKILTSHPSGAEDDTEWRFAVWRKGDRLATDRTDVAGQLRRRPIPPAKIMENELHRYTLGSASSISGRRGEYLGAESSTKSSSVGRGQSKWVTPKSYVPWQESKENSK